MDLGITQTNGLEDKKIDDYAQGFTSEGWHELYTSRKAGGRGLARIENCIDTSTQRHEDYIKKSKERLITIETNISTNRKRTKMSEEKQLIAYFKWQTNNIVHKNIWIWLRKGNLKRKTESLLIAAQNNAIRTNYVKAWIQFQIVSYQRL